jgi:hypothetical protein
MTPEEFSNSWTGIVSSDLLNSEIEGLSLEELTLRRAAMSELEKKVKALQESLRGAILEKTGYKAGQLDDITKETNVGNITLKVAIDKYPDSEKLQSMLIEKNIPVLSGMEEIKTLEPSISKLNFLISTGKLTETDVDSLKGSKVQVRVKPVADYRRVLED